MNNQMIAQNSMAVSALNAGQALTMSSREIAELTGKRHFHVTTDIEKMLKELGEDATDFRAIYCDSMNRQQTEYHLDRELTDTLLTGYSARLRRKVIARWRELELVIGSGAPVTKPQKLVGELAIMECFTRMLRPSPSSQLAMLTHIAKSNSLDASFLPRYAIDAASDAMGGSSMPTKPISDLLKAHGIGYTASAYNQLLRDAGLLEERTRRSTSKTAENGLKRFWAVSLEGLKYGKNITNPSSPRQTQPHWYDERFNELHALIVKRMAGKGQA